MPASTRNRSSIPLSLGDIASWHHLPGISVLPEVRASVPVLQRGLVWNPDQIELLWDSILRGFPIGALVLSAKIDHQTKEWEQGREDITHHLLDGQQRCDAIALGFKDPFGTPAATHEHSSILWIDLDRAEDQWSTREFLIRLTTPSHPWGYQAADHAKPLGAREIRDALRRIDKDPAVSGYVRPTATALCPQHAKVPVPLSWLLLNRGEDLWDHLKRRLKEVEGLPWHASLLAYLEDASKEPQRERIRKALRRAETTEIIALCSPSDLLESSRQEEESAPERAGISNIEHLFQRLNQQGTRLDGEELAYSMIKAYWPELAGPIDRIHKPMPASRLISLAIRAALAERRSERLPQGRGVSEIRKLAARQDKQTKQVHDYIQHHLEADCLKIREWLQYDPELNPSGLLPVHIASIARDSPEIFLLLLTFARRPAVDWEIPSAERPRVLQALATLVHWFGRDKPSVAQQLFAACREVIAVRKFQEALDVALEAGQLRPVHSPAAVESFLHADPSARLLDWSWGTLGHDSAPEEERHEIWARWGEFFGFRGQEELLLYVQRGFLHERFHDYDPSRKDLWKGHNRPWDYDHILARSYVSNQRGPFRTSCQAWLDTIGNFRAWPMEDNRSDQAEDATSKLLANGTLDRKRCTDSFLTEEELHSFSNGYDTGWQRELAIQFALGCRNRMLRIYRSWYEDAGVAELLPSAEESSDRGPNIVKSSLAN